MLDTFRRGCFNGPDNVIHQLVPIDTREHSFTFLDFFIAIILPFVRSKYCQHGGFWDICHAASSQSNLKKKLVYIRIHKVFQKKNPLGSNSNKTTKKKGGTKKIY